MKLYEIEYHSNNSGGHDWLSDLDWRTMYNVGWVAHINPYLKKPIEASFQFEAENDDEAVRTAMEKLREWEHITNQNANVSGCSCCGRPHRFYLMRLVNKDTENEETELFLCLNNL